MLRAIVAEGCHKIPQDLIMKKPCTLCNGYRLAEDALLIKINRMHIGKVTCVTIADCLQWFDKLESNLTQQEASIARI